VVPKKDTEWATQHIERGDREAASVPHMLPCLSSNKLSQGALAPLIVTGAEGPGEHDNLTPMDPDGVPVDLTTLVAAAQLRPFDMSCTIPEYEWPRLQRQEFGDDTKPTRDVIKHRKSTRLDAHADDLEFDVVWITDAGDVTSTEPVYHLRNSTHFKDYVKANHLVARVRKQ
jgi:hypothetical protein